MGRFDQRVAGPPLTLDAWAFLTGAVDWSLALREWEPGKKAAALDSSPKSVSTWADDFEVIFGIDASDRPSETRPIHTVYSFPDRKAVVKEVGEVQIQKWKYHPGNYDNHPNNGYGWVGGV